MPPRLKFDVMSELMDVVCMDATETTVKNGNSLNKLIRSNGSSRVKVVAALKNDTELCQALNMHSLDLAVLTSATLGTVSEDFSKLLLSKVRKLFGVVLH